MKILAVYTTKTGTVERCLDELKKNLPRADIVRANITSRACEYDIADFVRVNCIENYSPFTVIKLMKALYPIRINENRPEYNEVLEPNQID